MASTGPRPNRLSKEQGNKRVERAKPSLWRQAICHQLSCSSVTQSAALTRRRDPSGRAGRGTGRDWPSNIYPMPILRRYVPRAQYMHSWPSGLPRVCNMKGL